MPAPSAPTFYQLIGETLTTCEAASTRVGVPLLFPTRRVRAARTSVNEPIPDFVRESLVGVSTPVLQAYYDDLENMSAEAKELADLSVRPPTPVERFAIGVLFVLAVTLSVAGLGSRLAEDLLSILRFSSIAALALTLVTVLFTSEGYRRTTFSRVIAKELRRRRGSDLPNTNGVRLNLSQTSLSGDLNG